MGSSEDRDAEDAAVDGAAVDVAVLGAGPAGSATALALCRRGVPRVLLLDAPRRRRLAVGESVAPSVTGLLARLGLSVSLEALGHRPCHGTSSAWGGPELLVTDYLRSGLGPGFHLDRAAFDAWLRESAVAAGARLVTPASLRSVERGERGWLLRVRRGDRVEAIRAAVVVDASGPQAALARRLGARVRPLDRLVAVCVLAEPALPTEDRIPSLAGLSLVESFADGWWYGARVPSGRVMINLLTDGDTMRTLALRRPAALRRAFEATTHLRRAARWPAAGDGEPMVVSAASQCLDRALGFGWIAVGDALLRLDPLTSAGITGALDDALAASETVWTWLTARDGGSAAEVARAYARRAESTLRRYLQERRWWYAREGRWADRPFWCRRR